jgi:hypothetical protein
MDRARSSCGNRGARLRTRASLPRGTTGHVHRGFVGFNPVQASMVETSTVTSPIFRHPCAKSSPPRGAAGRSILKTPYFRPVAFLANPGAGIAFHTNEINVLRAVVLSIVLTLTVGQSAALLCNVWCHPVEGTTAAECGHPNTSPRVTSNDECKDAMLAPIAVVREEGRRGSSAPLAQPEVVVSRLAFVAAAVAASSDHPPNYQVLPAARPVVLPLRV